MRMKLAWLLCVAGIYGHAQTPGTFTATGSMNMPRYGHTATLLNNGKVLIAGGANSDGSLTSAELYDFSTGAFTRTGDMIAVEDAHSAILLPDGKVLIAGGSNVTSAASPRGVGAEIYDPSTGTFAATGKPVVPLTFSQGVLLGNGTVLLMGHDPSTAQINAQIYDPVSGTFAAAGLSPGTGGPLVLFGSLYTLTLLVDRRVLITGNIVTLAGVRLPALIYDPRSGTFSLTDPQSDGLETATLLMDGNVLFTGADDAGAPTNESKLYATSTGVFSLVGPSTYTWRGSAPATLLPDGTVLLMGGDFSDDILRFGARASAEIYNPAAGLFSPAGNMTAAREAHTATLLSDGTVLIAGGISSAQVAVATAEIYKPNVPVPAPVLFSLSGDGKGQAAIWHAQTGQIASAANPAVAGEALSMYTTSLTSNGLIPPQVVIGGRLAEILYFGDAPGYPGYYQVNVRMPRGIAPSPDAPVRLLYLGRASNEVTISVQ